MQGIDARADPDLAREFLSGIIRARVDGKGGGEKQEASPREAARTSSGEPGRYGHLLLIPRHAHGAGILAHGAPVDAQCTSASPKKSKYFTPAY
jgi:hypothetical protein